MKANKKMLASAMGIALSLVMAMESGVTAQAADKKDLSFLSGGIGMFLEPTQIDMSDRLRDLAKKLDISLGAIDDEEASTLVMANVKQELNVRSEANDDAEIVGKLYKDCGGEILERKDGWTKLRSGNIIGWANDEFLLFDEEAQELAGNVGKLIASVNTDTLRVRKEPDEKSEVYGLLPEGEIVDVIVKDDDEDADWLCVDYDGEEGYVAAEYVTLTFQIDQGETMEEYKARVAAEKEAKRHVNYGAYTTDADTTLLLAALIHCEAGGEPYEGQVAVGAVVMNRVRSSAYPDTIHGVIYASGQFTPAMNGKVNRVYESGKIYESCIRAAEEALSGVSNVGNLTHFRVNDGRDGLVIGHHVFF